MGRTARLALPSKPEQEIDSKTEKTYGSNRDSNI
jgi:hypothetical protein